MLSRSPTSCTPPLGVLGRTCPCLLPPSCQLTPGGNSQPLALTPKELLGQNPGEAVQPLHPPQILDPSRQGCIQRKGQDPPLAAPCGASCSIPGIIFCSNPDSGSGHRCPASLGWWTSSVTLFLLNGGHSGQGPLMDFPHLSEVPLNRGVPPPPPGGFAPRSLDVSQTRFLYALQRFALLLPQAVFEGGHYLCSQFLHPFQPPWWGPW